MKRRHGHTPRYSLERIQQIAARRDDRTHLTKSAIDGARALHLDADDVVDCVCALTADDYEQTLESTRVPGTFQDVYRPRFHGLEIYLKLRLLGDREVLVISFKRNTSA